MNDEIKEILDKLKETADYPKLNYSSYDKSYNETIDNVAMIKSFACKQLLNYITNLQKENERLKEENKHIFANVNDDELLISNAMNYAEAQDYKSRVEKAYEELTYMSSSDYVEDYDIKQNCWIKLSNILQNVINKELEKYE